MFWLDLSKLTWIPRTLIATNLISHLNQLLTLIWKVVSTLALKKALKRFLAKLKCLRNLSTLQAVIRLRTRTQILPQAVARAKRTLRSEAKRKSSRKLKKQRTLAVRKFRITRTSSLIETILALNQVQ